MNHLGIFAKFWAPGKVKTRLAATIGEVKSALVYRAMLNYLLDSLQSVGDQRIIAFTPKESENQFRLLSESLDFSWQQTPQNEGDLGARMAEFFKNVFSQSNANSHFGSFKRNVVLIGSDCPTITPDTCQAAFDSLQTHDMVLGPTFDGGYYLIGMSNRFHDVFSGIEYSTESVLQQTIKQMQNNNLTFSLLEPLQDIDELAQLIALQKTLAAAPQPKQEILWSIVENAVDSVKQSVNQSTIRTAEPTERPV